MTTPTPFSAQNFEHMVGTVRTDERGLAYRVTQVTYNPGNRWRGASVTVSGTVIDDKPGVLVGRSTTYGAYAFEIFTKNP